MKKLIYLKLFGILILMSGCSDREQSDILTPMLFNFYFDESSVFSRVAETEGGMGCVWSDGDVIDVKVAQGDSEKSLTCTLNNQGSVTNYSNQLYWEAPQATVTAWYSNASSVDIANQSNGLIYLLRTSGQFNCAKEPIQLKFTHQLAKVRVKVSGEMAEKVTSVKINNYTSFSFDGSAGTITPGAQGYITMKRSGEYFEANVIPTETVPSDFISLGDYFDMEITGLSKLEMGKIYTITIDAIRPPELETKINEHDAVLMRKLPPLYFATTNIGATNPEDVGLYFWWGDVMGHTEGDDFSFSQSNNHIITYNKTITQLYNSNIITTYNSTTAVLTSTYDAAYVKWGNQWRLPSEKELSWLINKNNCEWTWQDGSDGSAKGYKIVSKSTGGEIFLPVSGYYTNTNISNNKSTWGYYQTSSPSNDSSSSASLGFSKNTNSSITGRDRYYGLQVRPFSENK